MRSGGGGSGAGDHVVASPSGAVLLLYNDMLNPTGGLARRSKLAIVRELLPNARRTYKSYVQVFHTQDLSTQVVTRCEYREELHFAAGGRRARTSRCYYYELRRQFARRYVQRSAAVARATRSSRRAAVAWQWRPAAGAATARTSQPVSCATWRRHAAW